MYAQQGKVLEPRPNVVIVYADDLGYGDIGAYGAVGVQTPHLDRLASEGIRFTNAHASAATSTPSRYSILTGEYAWRRRGTDVAAGNAGMIIDSARYTLADLMHQAGYRTAAIGKWHLGLGSRTGGQDWNGELDIALDDLGFDYSYIMAATGDRVPCVFIENRRVAHYDASQPIEVSYDQPYGGEPLGSTHPELLTKQRSSHGHDMAIVNGIGRIGYMRGGGQALWQDEYIADSITAKALAFIEENREHPFFLYLATNDIHVPRYPHEHFRGLSTMGMRGDAIAQLDWTVGQVLAQLDRLGLADNTIVIFSSDNGAVIDDGYADEAEEKLGAHKPSGHLRGHKYSAFEGGTRVPALVRWPRVIAGGQVSDRLVAQIDWLASLAHLVGISLPSGVAPDSQEQAALWLGLGMERHPAEGRAWVVAQAANGTLSIRTEEWKYIEPSDGPKMIPWGPKIETGYSPEAQLYNLIDDPGERHNVASRYPEQVDYLRTLLARVRVQR